MNIKNFTIKDSLYQKKKLHKFVKFQFDQLLEIFTDVYLKKYILKK